MPLPKRRHSSTRQAKRRTHYKLTPPTLTTCQRCKSMAQAHHICPTCGYYNGRQWMTPKTVDTEV
ncbi:MAG: 50S ribosomal protein L32 [Capsulimonadales bacterium]|nr:50S ribosomal protein L32 [Capsulimonadales bacterium]